MNSKIESLIPILKMENVFRGNKTFGESPSGLLFLKKNCRKKEIFEGRLVSICKELPLSLGQEYESRREEILRLISHQEK